MVDIRDLENLNNKELRAKCLEYGLPNVPVTDTSRKLLIRRLHAVMEPSVANRAVKRQSMPAKKTDVSTTVNNKENVSRNPKRNTIIASVATAEQYPKASETYSTSLPGTSYGGSNYVSIAKGQQNIHKPIFEKDHTKVAKDTTDNHGFIRNAPIFIERRSNIETNYVNAQDLNQSRPLELSRSELLTTSYNQEISPLRKTYDIEYESDEPSDEYDSSSPYKPTTPLITENNLYQNRNCIVSSTKATNNSSEISPRSTYKTDRLSYSGLQTNYYNTLPLSANNNLSKIGRTPIELPSNLQRNTIYTEPNVEYDAAEESDLSSEPENVSYNYKRSLHNTQTGTHNYNAYGSVAVPAKQANNVFGPLREFFIRLEEEYHIKQALFIILIVIIAVFIYVVFVQDLPPPPLPVVKKV